MKVYVITVDYVLDCNHHPTVKIFKNKIDAERFAGENQHHMSMHEVKEWELE